MSEQEYVSLKEYLHLMNTRVKPPIISEYEEFLFKVQFFFALRAEAETYYRDHDHVAKSRHGALPIQWECVKERLRESGPPEQIITQIAKYDYDVLETLLGNLRKVLNRVREMVSLGHVQQVDSHCLRWLTRQPGRSPLEKAGARQEILGIVRKENYDTLENRVLKDFLRRCMGATEMYLRRYEKGNENHTNIKSVKRLRNLCVAGLEIETFASVRSLSDKPHPNYVLQQDQRYSKVWARYTELLNQTDVAENLWQQRAHVEEMYALCEKHVEANCAPDRMYETPLWIPVLDGKKALFEYPIWENERQTTAIHSPDLTDIVAGMDGEVRIIDLTHPWDDRNELVYPDEREHPNARPFLQNKRRPNRTPGKSHFLVDILAEENAEFLKDYFRQLYGLIGGKEWVVLVPDHYAPTWLEAILRARPSSLPRNKVFLLWRSVAATLGYLEQCANFSAGASIWVVDSYDTKKCNAVRIDFKQKVGLGVLPQRASTRLHADRFKLNLDNRNQGWLQTIRGDLLIGCGNVSLAELERWIPCFQEAHILINGVQRYLREKAKGHVSFFDERDALSMVVTTRAEEVVFKTLVEADECAPGGEAYEGIRQAGGVIQLGAKEVNLFLLEGQQNDNAPLKHVKKSLDVMSEQNTEISYIAHMTPGQGLAEISFDFFDKQVKLDLAEMKEVTTTKNDIERTLKRHFPPHMPLVESGVCLTFGEQASIRNYLTNGKLPQGDLFAKATIKPFNPQTASPVDRLKRVNVFGNEPVHRYPYVAAVDWNRFFAQLAKDYNNSKNKTVLQLIAWTYQDDCADFEPIREELFRRYTKRFNALEPKENTFCSNCFKRGDARIEGLIHRALTRISGGFSKQDEYRLLYNLLQFHPMALRNIETELCEKAVRKIENKYENFVTPRYGTQDMEKGSTTQKIGYYLNCLLFLLHRRRFDSEFIRVKSDWEPTGVLSWELPGGTPPRDRNEGTRKALINYMRGAGTLDIPLMN